MHSRLWKAPWTKQAMYGLPTALHAVHMIGMQCEQHLRRVTADIFGLLIKEKKVLKQSLDTLGYWRLDILQKLFWHHLGLLTLTANTYFGRDATSLGCTPKFAVAAELELVCTA